MPSGAPPYTSAANERPAKGPRHPGELHVNLEDVRHLELRYSRAQPEKMNLSVEYVGGRIKVFEVNRYLIERLLERQEDQGA